MRAGAAVWHVAAGMLDVQGLAHPMPDCICGCDDGRRQWLINAIFTTDQEILRSSGMDAFVMTKALAIGIQLFLPIAVLGVAVCESGRAAFGPEQGWPRRAMQSFWWTNDLAAPLPAVLPVNYSQVNRLQGIRNQDAVVKSDLMYFTISAVPQGSSVMW